MKIAVYTAIFGSKDQLKDPLNFDSGNSIDYFCFSDEINPSSTYRQIIKFPVYKDPTLNSRYYKIIGDTVLKNYDFLIWHDGNIQIDESTIMDLIENASNFFLTTFQHPNRNCFYDEACVCIRRNKDNPFIIVYQVLSYKWFKLPPFSGLFETGILVKNNIYKEDHFFAKWWDHTFKYSKRDQLSLAFLYWSEKKVFGTLPGNGTDNKFSKYWPHSVGFQGNLTRKFLNFVFVKLIKGIK